MGEPGLRMSVVDFVGMAWAADSSRSNRIPCGMRESTESETSAASRWRSMSFRKISVH